jgi:hypothetical protein
MRHFSRGDRELGRLIYLCAIVPLLVYGWIRFLNRPRRWWEIAGMIVVTLLSFVSSR